MGLSTLYGGRRGWVKKKWRKPSIPNQTSQLFRFGFRVWLDVFAEREQNQILSQLQDHWTPIDGRECICSVLYTSFRNCCQLWQHKHYRAAPSWEPRVSLALGQPEPQLLCAALAAWKHHLCFGLHIYLCRGTDSAFAQWDSLNIPAHFSFPSWHLSVTQQLTANTILLIYLSKHYKSCQKMDVNLL